MYKEGAIMAEGSGIVVDQGKWEWSEMWKKEDWWAIWIGFFLLVAAVCLFPPFRRNEGNH